MLGINGYERGYRDIAGLILGIESEGRQHAFVRTKKAKPPEPVAFASGQGRPVHARTYICWVLAHQNRHERMDLAYRTNDTHTFHEATEGDAARSNFRIVDSRCQELRHNLCHFPDHIGVDIPNEATYLLNARALH